MVWSRESEKIEDIREGSLYFKFCHFLCHHWSEAFVFYARVVSHCFSRCFTAAFTSQFRLFNYLQFHFFRDLDNIFLQRWKAVLCVPFAKIFLKRTSPVDLHNLQQHKTAPAVALYFFFGASEDLSDSTCPAKHEASSQITRFVDWWYFPLSLELSGVKRWTYQPLPLFFSLLRPRFWDARDHTIPGSLSLSLAPGDGKKRGPGNKVGDFLIENIVRQWLVRFFESDHLGVALHTPTSPCEFL